MSSPTIVLLGATGYIGGSVLTALLEKYPDSEIRLQYRSDSQKDTLQKLSKNIVPVKASLDDTDILSSEASKADVVVGCADCDDMASNSAILEGLEKGAAARVEAKKGKAVWIHTSGTGELVDLDFKIGELDETMYDDGNLEQLKSIPDSRYHRKVTNKVIEGFERGQFLGFVVLPSIIYGPGTGPFNRVSQQIPNLILNALHAGHASYVLPGKNAWSYVHISSLANLYVSLIELLVSPSAPHPPKQGEGLTHYITAASPNGPLVWSQVAKKVGDIMFDMGDVKQGGAVGEKECKVPGTDTTSVAISSRAKELVGWEDKETVWNWLKTDVEDAVKKFKSENTQLKKDWGQYAAKK